MAVTVSVRVLLSSCTNTFAKIGSVCLRSTTLVTVVSGVNSWSRSINNFIDSLLTNVIKPVDKKIKLF